MKCPKCGKEGLRYLVNRTKVLTEKHREVRRRRLLPRAKRKKGSGQAIKKNTEPRTDFKAVCKKCGWQGEYKTALDRAKLE